MNKAEKDQYVMTVIVPQLQELHGEQNPAGKRRSQTTEEPIAHHEMWYQWIN
jgi:hypothetical protein